MQKKIKKDLQGPVQDLTVRYQFILHVIRKVRDKTEEAGGIVVFIQNYSLLAFYKTLLQQ